MQAQVQAQTARFSFGKRSRPRQPPVTSAKVNQARSTPSNLIRPSGGRSTRAAAVCLLAVLTAAVFAALGAELVLAYRTPPLAPAQTDWTAEDNADLVARFYAEVWNGGKRTLMALYIANDHSFHDPATPEVPAGPDGVAQIVAGLRQTFPDLALTLDDVVARGDRVVVRFTARGTHRGMFLGAEGTGVAVTVTGVAVHRIADAQIAETWLNWDTFGVAQQVGLFMVPLSALGEWEGAPGPKRSGERH